MILHQVRGAPVMIMVNEGHSGLKTPKGQLAIALNDASQPFKILDEQRMDNLLASFNNYGLARVATTFERGDERYFGGDGGGTERYRGILYVEDNGVRSKVVGVRAMGESDLAGQDRYKVYSELKAIFSAWFNEVSQAQLPELAGPGGNGP